MSASKITSQDLSLVGGIAFTQKAIPDFKVNSTSVYFSKIDSTAHLVLNGVDITVPLYFFQLRPIVNFANSDKNVVMTRYGARYGLVHRREQSAEILYHPAFIDNLLGLRLLQVDVMGELGANNIDFPRIGDDYLLAPEETVKLEEMKRTNPDYRQESVIAVIEVNNIISKYLGNDGFTFIYTDVKEPIYFDLDIDNKKIIFRGHPYFLFGKVNDKRVDKFTFYSHYRSYCDQFMKKADKEQNLAILDRVLKRNFEEGFLRIDAQQNKSIGQKSSELLKAMYDEESPVYKAYVEQFSILRGFYNPGWNFSVDLLSQWFPLYEEVTEATEALKTQPIIIRHLNPIVYEEVDDICLWASLFRFVKIQSPSMWKRFVSDINSIPLPPPAVKTPVSLQRESPSSSFTVSPEFAEIIRRRFRDYLDSLIIRVPSDSLKSN